ncbi:MAG: DUF58 domain-containing protein [Thermodesulfovibrio sp.]|nr:DUF58 domain-containing protein [Thermodesulfovibrio sp.]
MMALSGVISIYNLKNFKFALLPHSDIFAQSPANLKLEIRKQYFLPSYLIRLKINETEKILPFINNRDIVNVNLVFQKRGRIKISEVSISSYFPFFFFKRTIKIPVDYEVIVFPKPIKSDFSIFLSEGKTKFESILSKGKSFEGEIVGVKAYYPQDPLKYINWKATAKTSELMTKEFSPYRGNPVIIDLSDFTGDVEQKIGKATFAILDLSKNGIPVGLKLENAIYKPDLGQAHIRRVLHALALY